MYFSALSTAFCRIRWRNACRDKRFMFKLFDNSLIILIIKTLLSPLGSHQQFGWLPLRQKECKHLGTPHHRYPRLHTGTTKDISHKQLGFAGQQLSSLCWSFSLELSVTSRRQQQGPRLLKVSRVSRTPPWPAEMCQQGGGDIRAMSWAEGQPQQPQYAGKGQCLWYTVLFALFQWVKKDEAMLGLFT